MRLPHGGTVATLVALVILATLPAAAGAAQVRRGPAGTAFYRPPSPLGAGPGHGGLIWARRATGAAVVPGAARTDLVLYRTIGIHGRPVAVSGAVSIPRGHAPKGGWPVVTWAHGTTGIADVCAPTRAPRTGVVNAFTTYAYPTFRRWLRAGFAVVRTDYEGLGTPGAHPYLNGTSEGRSVLDVVRAARRLRPSLGRRLLVAGHSQGGQAALWAAALTPRWTPELDLRSTVAFAPVSHLGEQGRALRTADISGGLTGLVALILRGVEVRTHRAGVLGALSHRARALFPQTLTRCIPGLGSARSFGGMPTSALFGPRARLARIIAVLDLNDAETRRIRRPVLVEQGAADSTVFPAFTDQLVTELRERGARLRYRKLPGVGHGDVVGAAATDATRWMRQRTR